jgi:predicted Zn-dependent peptidase
VPSYRRNHPNRFALGILNSALGGGTSSRLFQEVREQRGLAYTIYSFGSQNVDSGYFAIGGACTPRNLPDVLGICRDELAKVASAGLTVEEFERGKGQLRGSLVMGLEDSSSRMTRIGKAELVPGGVLSIDETLARINAVTLDHIHAVAQELLTVEPTLAALGPAKAVNKLL